MGMWAAATGYPLTGDALQVNDPEEIGGRR
jgi:hypothetical protein